MPTTRRRRLHPPRTTLTPALESFLKTGDYGGDGPVPGWFEVFELAGGVMHGNYNEARARWAEHGAQILADWIRDHPGTRPFAWWIVEAPEPRRVLDGAQHFLPPGAAWWEPAWRGACGIPAMQQIGHFMVMIEPEAAYLVRLRLLAPGERRRLTAEDFEPEEITVESETHEELTERRIARDAARGGNGPGGGPWAT